MGPNQPLLTSVLGTNCWFLVSLSLSGVTGQGQEGQAQRSNDSRVQQMNWVSDQQPFHRPPRGWRPKSSSARPPGLLTIPPPFLRSPRCASPSYLDTQHAFPVGCLTLWNKVGNTLIFKIRQTKCQCVCVLGWKFLKGKDHVCLYSTWHSVKSGLNK